MIHDHDNQHWEGLVSGCTLQIRAFDEVPEHLFKVETVEDGFVTGFALTGPLKGEYGEPDFQMILRVMPDC